jgi:hypothetical protein
VHLLEDSSTYAYDSVAEVEIRGNLFQNLWSLNSPEVCRRHSGASDSGVMISPVSQKHVYRQESGRFKIDTKMSKIRAFAMMSEEDRKTFRVRSILTPGSHPSII